MPIEAFFSLITTIMRIGAGIMVAFIVISLAITVFMCVCQWRVYRKLGLRGWECLIPFYNIYVLSDVCGVPILGIASIALMVLAPTLMFFEVTVLAFISMIALIAAFVLQCIIWAEMLPLLGKPRWLLILGIFCGIVFWPILAFTD